MFSGSYPKTINTNPKLVEKVEIKSALIVPKDLSFWIC